MADRKELSAAERQQMIEHLEHEVAMFCGALAEFTELDVPDVLKLKRDDPVRIRRTAFFEVALLHARVLDEFLLSKPTRDDWCAGHVVEGWKPEDGPLDRVPSLSTSNLSVRESINKQLAHMTTERLQQSDFRLRDVAEEIIRGMREFVERTDILGDPDFERLHAWLYATWSTRRPPVESGS